MCNCYNQSDYINDKKNRIPPLQCCPFSSERANKSVSRISIVEKKRKEKKTRKKINGYSSSKHIVSNGCFLLANEVQGD